MIKFKVCPRCQGDLYLSDDIFGKYCSCMQCGYLKDLVKPLRDSNPKSDTVHDAELEVA